MLDITHDSGVEYKNSLPGGAGPVVGRKVHWESRQPGRQSAAADSETGTATGNSGNALQVAENEAKKVRLYY